MGPAFQLRRSTGFSTSDLCLELFKSCTPRRRGFVEHSLRRGVQPGLRAYCFGAAGLGVVVVGRGRAVVGPEGPDGAGAATPEDAL